MRKDHVCHTGSLLGGRSWGNRYCKIVKASLWQGRGLLGGLELSEKDSSRSYFCAGERHFSISFSWKFTGKTKPYAEVSRVHPRLLPRAIKWIYYPLPRFALGSGQMGGIPELMDWLLSSLYVPTWHLWGGLMTGWSPFQDNQILIQPERGRGRVLKACLLMSLAWNLVKKSAGWKNTEEFSGVCIGGGGGDGQAFL